ncbi:MAG: thiol reductase thioredoxin [Crocinitomicaceae bacterium]|jgi:thiol-disulfide isomerase/thioredoxin|nr:thiol reductase thioredoxin [Crocinitomicaceae bacterium]
MLELNEDNLSQTMEPRAVVLYGAPWCGNCRLLKPKFKKLAGETEGVQFVYVNAEKFTESRGLADVSNLPTIAAFENGTLKAQKQGNKIDLVNELLQEFT